MMAQKESETRYICADCGRTHHLKAAFLEVVVGYNADRNPVRRFVCKYPYFRGDDRVQPPQQVDSV